LHTSFSDQRQRFELSFRIANGVVFNMAFVRDSDVIRKAFKVLNISVAASGVAG
jgi:hypothetical protein